MSNMSDSHVTGADETPANKPTEEFHKGVAISMWQNSGGENSNWGQFVNQRGKCFGLYPNIMDRSDPSEASPDFWHRYGTAQACTHISSPRCGSV